MGLAGVLAAAPAAAAPFVDVTYDLTDSSAVSTIDALGITTEIPPHGEILAGSRQTMRYTGGSGTYAGVAGSVPTIATGPVELLTFNFYVHATVGTYDFNGDFYTVNTSDLHFEFLSLTKDAAALGGQGQRTADGRIDPLGASGYFQVTGNVHCYVGCLALNVPASTTLTLVPYQFTAPLPTLTGADGYPQTIGGTATGVRFFVKFEGYRAIAIDVTGTTFIAGREVDRTAVPEPSTLPLLAGGLVGLGLAGAAWRRRGAALRSARGAGVLGVSAVTMLALGTSPTPAQAAPAVDVTYDLADTDLVWNAPQTILVLSNDDDSFSNFSEDQQAGLIDGSMQVRYASDSSSGLPILSGPATLQSFALTAKSLVLSAGRGSASATLRWELTAPATASLTAAGALTGLDAGLLMTGHVNCLYEDGRYTADEVCRALFGVPSYTVYPSYFRSGPLELAGTAVPSGGIQSTRHTLTGRGRAIGFQPGAGVVGLGYDRRLEDQDIGGAYLVGREILREGEGHPDKVVPEPGTLLLLGAGTAGLALVRHRHRRSGVH